MSFGKEAMKRTKVAETDGDKQESEEVAGQARQHAATDEDPSARFLVRHKRDAWSGNVQAGA